MQMRIDMGIMETIKLSIGIVDVIVAQASTWIRTIT